VVKERRGTSPKTNPASSGVF